MKNAIYLLCLFFTSILLLTSYDNESWKNKVDEDLLIETRDNSTSDFLVIMKEQADISTDHLKYKEEKGTFVYNTLKEKASNSQVDIKSWMRNEGVQYRSYFIVNMIHVYGGYDVLKSLAQRDDVARINANPLVHQDFEQAVEEREREVNLIEWGITKIKADSVWIAGYSGTGIVVGGQDTGYDWDHPAIKDQYRGWDGTTADHNYNWHDAIHVIDAGNTGTNPCGLNSMVPCDDHNHGTHTMGTMVGDDGAGNQIGVAPGARWIGCRNMERGDGTPMTYIECFEWFLAPTDLNDMNADPSKAPHVINNSWGCPPSEGCNPANFATMETALNNLKASGVVVVVSAGNSGSGCSSVDDPAAIFEGSFTVGAMDIADNIAGFSSRGPVTVDGSNRMKPNIAAPGVSVRSCVIGTGYATFSGTSMAGPHVAGAVALILDKHPSLVGDPDGIEDLIESTAVQFTTNQNCGTDNSSSVPNNTFGWGEIDVYAAVNEMLVLPLDWISFVGENNIKGNQLNWTITNQINIQKYIIERSEDGIHFDEINVVQSQNDEVILNYVFYDKNPRLSYYYRIGALEIDGSLSYSDLVHIGLSGMELTQLFPNPVKDKLHIIRDSETDLITYNLVNSLGQILIKGQLQKFETELNVKSLPRGIYYLQLNLSPNNIELLKVVLK